MSRTRKKRAVVIPVCIDGKHVGALQMAHFELSLDVFPDPYACAGATIRLVTSDMLLLHTAMETMPQTVLLQCSVSPTRPDITFTGIVRYATFRDGHTVELIYALPRLPPHLISFLAAKE